MEVKCADLICNVETLTLLLRFDVDCAPEVVVEAKQKHRLRSLGLSDLVGARALGGTVSRAGVKVSPHRARPLRLHALTAGCGSLLAVVVEVTHEGIDVERLFKLDFDTMHKYEKFMLFSPAKKCNRLRSANAVLKSCILPTIEAHRRQTFRHMTSKEPLIIRSFPAFPSPTDTDEPKVEYVYRELDEATLALTLDDVRAVLLCDGESFLLEAVLDLLSSSAVQAPTHIDFLEIPARSANLHLSPLCESLQDMRAMFRSQTFLNCGYGMYSPPHFMPELARLFESIHMDSACRAAHLYFFRCLPSLLHNAFWAPFIWDGWEKSGIDIKLCDPESENRACVLKCEAAVRIDRECVAQVRAARLSRKRPREDIVVDEKNRGPQPAADGNNNPATKAVVSQKTQSTKSPRKISCSETGCMKEISDSANARKCSHKRCRIKFCPLCVQKGFLASHEAICFYPPPAATKESRFLAENT